VATLLFALGVTVQIPIMPLYITDELGVSERWLGTSALVISLAAVAIRIPGGALSDQWGRRRILLIGAALGVIAGAIYVASRSLPVFLVARAITGASLALFTTAGKAMAADLAPASRRGEALGLTNTAFSVAIIISPLISEGLKNELGFQAVFVFSTVLSVIALAMAYTLPESRPREQVNLGARNNLTAALRERGTWAALFLIIGLGSVLAMLFNIYPVLAERKDLYHDAPDLLTGVAMGLGLSLWALLDAVIEPLAGRLSDRVGRQPVALPGLIVALIGVVALSQASTTYGTYLAIMVMTLGWGSARAVVDSISQDAVAPALRGMSAALLYTGFDLAMGFGAQILSVLIDGDRFGPMFQALIALLGVFGLIGLVLSTRLVAYERRSPISVPPATGD
jgi:predicted MFS family arabinose efflux permease